MRVKISIGEDYRNVDLSQFLSAEEFGQHEFVFNSPVDYADFWFVIEGTQSNDTTCFVPRDRVFYLGAETARAIGFYYETPGWLGYLKQFAKIYSSQELYWSNATLSFPFLPWMINANHGPDLFAKSDRNLAYLEKIKQVPKTKLMSVFCSAQGLTAEHRSRLRFVESLKSHFGDRLDWYGNGINSVEQKWNGLAPYKYSIVLENQSTPYVLTEKIQDSFLALSMPIYWGAPQAADLFAPGSLVEIDIRNKNEAISKIEKLLEEDRYESTLPLLVDSKSVVTQKLNFMRRIIQIVSDTSLEKPETRSLVTIRPVSHFSPGKNIVDRLHKPLSNIVNQINQRIVRK